MAAGSRQYDLELFETLAREYRKRPERKAPVRRDEQAMKEKAQKRLTTMSRQLGTDFRDKDVLELGCGHGWLTAFLPALAGARRAVGVDPRRYPAWDEHTDPRVELLEVDLAAEHPIAPGSIDLVLSGAVLEHVDQPVEMLAAIHDILRPGGRAWLYFNLYRGPQASHRYNEVPFPWPHLIFDDEVCVEYYARHHDRRNVRFAWVNRMTIANYVQVCQELRFAMLALHRRVVPIDVGFYLRFEEVLGRYPALDLETDFATLILEKPDPAAPAAAPKPLPELGYLAAQRSLNEAVAARRPGS